jgi:phenylpropionate dioxygenase-like ring-hydroxylating dioxygenase large terminal subunit
VRDCDDNGATLHEAGDRVRQVLAQLPTEGDPEALRRMLPADCYTDPAFFEFEQRAVFSHNWICVGRIEQIPNIGDCLSATPAGEQILVVRGDGGEVRALSAVCQHRGATLSCPGTSGARHMRCPLHFWSYDLTGKLVGAPRVGTEELRRLRGRIALPAVRVELWHGFIFVNLDGAATALAPTLEKLEAFWEGYEAADLVAIPPRMADSPLPWNWKVHVENFTDAYHPEFVHRGTHDFAPSVHGQDGVRFTPMQPGDNAIVRSVPLLRPDGGMMADGWGEPAAFPAIPTVPAQHRARLVFAMLPPSMTLVFAPGAIAYTLISPAGCEATRASSDRVTAGGWLLPRTTVDLPDFDQRKATVLEGAAKIWAQDVPINLGLQAGKRSRFTPPGYYTALETTLVQFNAWLLHAYRDAAARRFGGSLRSG